MANLYERKLSLTGIRTEELSAEELKALVKEILVAGIHGISFSPYTARQTPGDPVSAALIRERLGIIQPHVRWIRTFSCTEGNEQTPAIAKEMGLKTLVGIWLGEDLEKNEAEIANGLEVAAAGNADILGVGNEVLLRGDLTEDQLIDYMQRVRAEAPAQVPIGYVDAYFLFEMHPRVAEVGDVVLANCYPFWESCPAEHALLYMKEMYRRAVRVANGKPVIVSETGWPNLGSAMDGAVPSFNNAIKYFVDTCRWAEEENIDVIYFSSFDEAWKIEKEGDVGAHWGLWDKDGNPKYV